MTNTLSRRESYKQRRKNYQAQYLNKKLLIKLVLLTILTVFVGVGNYCVVILIKDEPRRAFLNAVFIVGGMSIAALLNLRPKS